LRTPGLLILEKGNIFSTDRLLFSIIVLAIVLCSVPSPFCRKLLLTTEAAVRHKLGVEFAACFSFSCFSFFFPSAFHFFSFLRFFFIFYYFFFFGFGPFVVVIIMVDLVATN